VSDSLDSDETTSSLLPIQVTARVVSRAANDWLSELKGSLKFYLVCISYSIQQVCLH